MTYDIDFKPQAVKDLKPLPKKVRSRVVARIQALKDDLAGDVKKLTDYTPEYRAMKRCHSGIMVNHVNLSEKRCHSGIMVNHVNLSPASVP